MQPTGLHHRLTLSIILFKVLELNAEGTSSAKSERPGTAVPKVLRGR